METNEIDYNEESNEINLTVSSKERLRKEVEQQVADFLKRGGKIQVIDTPAKHRATNNFSLLDDDD